MKKLCVLCIGSAFLLLCSCNKKGETNKPSPIKNLDNQYLAIFKTDKLSLYLDSVKTDTASRTTKLTWYAKKILKEKGVADTGLRKILIGANLPGFTIFLADSIEAIRVRGDYRILQLTYNGQLSIQ
jgi:hypothetical protein